MAVQGDSRNKKLVCSTKGTKGGKIHGLASVLKWLVEPPAQASLPEGVGVRALLLASAKLVSECADLDTCAQRICHPRRPETLTAVLALLLSNDSELVTTTAAVLTALTQHAAAGVGEVRAALREAEPEPLATLGHAVLALGPELVLKPGDKSARDADA